MNKRIKRGFLGIFCLLIVILAAGCGLIEREIVQDPNVLDSQQYLPETVYVGAVLPLSDATAGAAASYAAAAHEVALDIINQSHPLDWELAAANGIPGYGAAALELVQRDSGSGNSASPRPTSIVAGEAAAELAELGVVSLSGALLPPDTWAVAGEAAEAALPLISGAGLPYQYLSALSSQTASVTTTPAAGQTAGGTAASTRQPELDWLFCVMPTPDMQSELLFTYLRQLNQTENAGIEQIAFIYEDTAYGRAVLASFDAAAAHADFTVAARVSYSPNTTNVAEEVQRIMTAGADALFHAGTSDDLLLFAKTYADAQFTPAAAVAYGDPIRSNEFRTTMREREIDYWSCYSLTPLPFESEAAASSPELTEYQYINDLYRERTGRDLDNDAVCEFAALAVLAQAVSAAGSTEAEALVAVLRDTAFAAPYLAGGSIDFDENGRNTVGGCVARLVEGELLLAYR